MGLLDKIFGRLGDVSPDLEEKALVLTLMDQAGVRSIMITTKKIAVLVEPEYAEVVEKLIEPDEKREMRNHYPFYIKYRKS